MFSASGPLLDEKSHFLKCFTLKSLPLQKFSYKSMDFEDKSPYFLLIVYLDLWEALKVFWSIKLKIDQ